MEVELLKTPTTTCTWFKSGQPIEHSDKFQIWHADASKDPVQSVLIIMNLTLDDAAEYTFRASNDLGECATSATVIVQRKFICLRRNRLSGSFRVSMNEQLYGSPIIHLIFHSFFHSFIQLFIHSFIHSFTCCYSTKRAYWPLPDLKVIAPVSKCFRFCQFERKTQKRERKKSDYEYYLLFNISGMQHSQTSV